MGTEAASRADTFSSFEQLRYARDVLRVEGQALLDLSDGLGDEFCQVVDLLAACRGSVNVTGMGKAGLVGNKIAATLASTGTRSHFLHPAEALHGDLGRIHRDDVMIMLSFSGETEETVALLPSLKELAIPLVTITGNPSSQLGRAATVVLDLGPLKEACSLGLAPSTSTTAMLALGDALALVLSRRRRFGAEDFARFHPGGSLGRKLAKVEDIMRPLQQCRVAHQSQTVRDVLTRLGRPGRRTGAVMLTDDEGKLQGIFTDSDLARLLEARRDADLNGPVRNVMTASPTAITQGERLTRALELLVERKISELPVIDADGAPVGQIDITDVFGLLPHDGPLAERQGSDPDMLPRDELPVETGRDTVPFPVANAGDRS